MLLTDDEIKAIDPDGLAEGFARAIESAVLEKLKAQEPVLYADKDAVMDIKHSADTFDLAIGVRNNLERDGDVPLYTHPLPPADVVRDAERLDWLEKNLTGASDSERYLPFRVYWGDGRGIRKAIDKAMKEMK